MPEEDAREIMRSRGLEPQEPYPGSGRPWRCTHTCGRSVTPTLSNIRAGRGLCRYCNSDFPYDGPAVVYLVVDQTAVKVGICSPDRKRIDAHKRLGWDLAWTISVGTGDEAYNIEQAMIAWWRDELKAPPAYTRHEMPQQGHTETALWDDIHPTLALETARQISEQLGVEELRTEITGHADTRPKATAGPLGVRARARLARNPGQPTLPFG